MLKYLTYLPINYNKDIESPLMIFLHGATERGDDFSLLKQTEPVVLLEKKELELPVITIAPLCPKFESWNYDILDEMLEEIKNKYKINDKKIYLTGFSMGGIGVLRWAQKSTNKFAAIVALCAGGSRFMAEYFKNLPIWFFHGKKDEIVNYKKTEDLYKELSKYNTNTKITLLEDEGHSIWGKVYRNFEIYQWLMSYERS